MEAYTFAPGSSSTDDTEDALLTEPASSSAPAVAVEAAMADLSPVSCGEGSGGGSVSG